MQAIILADVAVPVVIFTIPLIIGRVSDKTGRISVIH